MTDTQTLIFAAYALVMLAVVLIVALWLSKPLRAKHPRLLSLAVWCLLGALTLAIAKVVL